MVHTMKDASIRPMRRAGLLRCAAALSLGLLFAATVAAQSAKVDLVGKEVPTLSGPGRSGQLVNLQKLRREVEFLKDAQGQLIKTPEGRLATRVTDYVLVVNFFATYCVPCVKEIPTFNKIATSYPGKPVRFIYVNVDVEKTPAEVKTFAASRGIDVEMIFPSVSYAIKQFGIETLPRIVVVDTKGVVTQVITGFHDDLAAQIREVVTPLLPKT
jgi:thiol-disulfide isomerase/thioredoxin